ncbi:MFS transporter [Agrobacterium sp.]|uniref:MFS transporter n=1 Tax=Agrobacterium sp. TaxID=361 RepID=UPI0028AD0299|nr:MFS transporter [Agrobacterium sp.]
MSATNTLPEQAEDEAALSKADEHVVVAEPPPAAPAAPPEKSLGGKLVYIAAGLLFFITQGLGMNIVTANMYQLQGEFSATVAEVVWLSAAYMAPYASLSIALFKIRAQYGLRPFAELSIFLFVLASCLNLFVTDLHSAIIVRFVSGMAAAPLSSLGFLYILEAFPPHRKLSFGLCTALTGTLLSAPIARIISPSLMEIDGWRSLYTLELGVALIALPAIYLLPLTAPPRAKILERIDVLSYLFMGTGLGFLAFFFSLGRFYWWLETSWLGLLLAAAIVCLTCMVLIELHRKNPMIDLRWIFTRQNIHTAAVLIMFRAVTSEQSTTAVSFYQQLGVINDQTMALYGIILLATIIGGVFCAFLMLTKYVETAHVIALSLIAIGAFLDSQATNLTRPEQMYFSQAMIACGAAMFLPPVMAKGFASAMAKGLPYLVNFIAIFLFTQISGSLMMTALLGSFVTVREKFHSNILAEHIVLTDPNVAQRISQLASSYGKVITDKTLLNAEGVSLLTQQVTREAYVLAYTDTFLAISVVTAIALGMLLIHLAWNRLKPLLMPAEPAATPQNS